MNNEVLTTHWEDLAHDYDKIMKDVPIMEQLIINIKNELSSDSRAILDLGTGTGALLEKVHQHCPEAYLTALDLSDAMLEQAKKTFKRLKNIEFVKRSAHDLQFSKDEQYDSVISNYALHHLTHYQKKLCAIEVFRVLKAGGKFIFGDQHCRSMGKPDEKEWLIEMLDLLYAKAKHYLLSASIERMLLQIELMPKFLKADGEIMATVEYWESCLIEAGFKHIKCKYIAPNELLNCVIVASKE